MSQSQLSYTSQGRFILRVSDDSKSRSNTLEMNQDGKKGATDLSLCKNCHFQTPDINTWYSHCHFHRRPGFVFFYTSNSFNIFTCNNTYRNCRLESLKTLDGSTVNRFLLSFNTSKVLEILSKQPGSRTLILLLLKFLEN